MSSRPPARRSTRAAGRRGNAAVRRARPFGLSGAGRDHGRAGVPVPVARSLSEQAATLGQTRSTTGWPSSARPLRLCGPPGRAPSPPRRIPRRRASSGATPRPPTARSPRPRPSRPSAATLLPRPTPRLRAVAARTRPPIVPARSHSAPDPADTVRRPQPATATILRTPPPAPRRRRRTPWPPRPRPPRARTPAATRRPATHRRSRESPAADAASPRRPLPRSGRPRGAVHLAASFAGASLPAGVFETWTGHDTEQKPHRQYGPVRLGQGTGFDSARRISGNCTALRRRTSNCR